MSNTTILNPTLYYTPNNSASFGKSLNICQGNKNPPRTPLKCDTHSHARAPNPPNQSSGSLVFIEHPHHHPRTANKDVCLYMRFSFPCAQTARHLMRGYTNSLYTLNASHTSHAGLAPDKILRGYALMVEPSKHICEHTMCAQMVFIYRTICYFCAANGHRIARMGVSSELPFTYECACMCSHVM